MLHNLLCFYLSVSAETSCPSVVPRYAVRPSEWEVWLSDGQKDEPHVEIWGSGEKVAYQLYCIQAQLSMCACMCVHSSIVLVFFFSLMMIREVSATPFSHTESAVFLTAHFSWVFVFKHAVLLSMCSLVIRHCYLQNVWSHGHVDGQWWRTTGRLNHKISVKDRCMTHFVF